MTAVALKTDSVAQCDRMNVTDSENAKKLR